jgi:hypothetical protein
MPLFFITKSPISPKFKYSLFCFLFCIFIKISTVSAADNIRAIELSLLGSFDVNFSEVNKVNLMKGQSLIGEVGYMSGENYSVTLPFNVQRISYQVKQGSIVNQGDIVALVEGYDIHHFIDEYQSAKVLLAIQEMHFKTNKQYFEKKTIQSSQWIEITKSYYDAKLKFEHFQHLMSFVQIDKNEKISLISPKGGVIQIPSSDGSKMFGELAFDIIDNNAIKVKVAVPLILADNLSHFIVNSSCDLKISSVEKLANKFHQIFWAEANSSGCELLLGQIIKVTPVKHMTGYKVSKSAVFEFENKNYIAIKLNESLSLIPIELIGLSEEEYIFTTKESIEGRQALISSVSILQGSLLSLGAE